MHSEIFSLIRATGKTTAEISSENGQQEGWLFEVLSGKRNCTSVELEKLATTLKVSREYLNFLISNTKSSKSSDISKIKWLVLDKVVIGFFVLSIALGTQWQYEKYATQRDKAVAASNLTSEYLKKNFSMFQSSFVSLLATSDAILDTKVGNYDNSRNRSKLAEIIQYETEVKLYVELLMLNEELTKTGTELLKDVAIMTSRLKSLKPNNETREARDSLGNKLGVFSQHVQERLILLVREEVNDVA